MYVENEWFGLSDLIHNLNDSTISFFSLIFRDPSSKMDIPALLMDPVTLLLELTISLPQPVSKGETYVIDL